MYRRFSERNADGEEEKAPAESTLRGEGKKSKVRWQGEVC